MKSVLSAALVSGLLAASVSAANVNMRIEVAGMGSDGATSIQVAPNTPVTFRIEADLTDNLNEGLALIGFDLDFTGGNLASNTINIPAGTLSCANPMPAFVKPQGITNPAGYGGTLIGGDLIQVGGGQNTIKNTADNADFPIGAVQLGVAKPAGCGTAVIATGTVNAPGADGTYQLNILNVFANVIKQGETGAVFFATEAAGVGTTGNLQITVQSVVCVDNVAAVSSVPADQGSLWRSAKNVARITLASNVAAVPTIQVREMLAGGAYGPNIAAITKTLESGGTVIKIADPASNLLDGKWYAVTADTDCDFVADFIYEFVVQIGDADGNKFVTAVDVGLINSQPQGPVADSSRFDIDGNGFRTAVDVGLANANQGPPPAKPSGH